MNSFLRIPRVRNLIVFSSLIMLIFCAIMLYQASRSYDKTLNDSKIQAERMIHIMGDHIELTFLAVDLTLRRVIERSYFNDLFGGNIPEDLLHNIRKWVDETPQISAMLLVDETGKGLVGAHKRGYDNWIDYENFDFSQSDFFVKSQSMSDQFFWISKLDKRSGFKNDLIVISRPITSINGEFGGLVMAAIEPEYFEKYFRSIQNQSQSQLLLSLEDGTAIIGSENAVRVKNAVKESNYTGAISTSKGLQILSKQQLRNLPVSLAIVLNEKDILMPWWDSRYKDFAFLAIFLIFGSVLSFFAITTARQIARVEKSESAAVLASQAKSEFLANMSHELRTPLNAIIGFSEMLNSGYFGPLNPKQKERTNDINLCGSHLLQLITDILEFSKGEAGKLDLNEEKASLSDIVNETLRMMNERIRSKSIHVNVDIEKDLPRMWGDKRKLRQILLNLLSNAVKFTPTEGSVKIALRLDNQRNLILVVTDTGIGIPESKIATALSVFGQVHREQSHEGTGLGLPLCRMFAELHGGKLAIGSTEGEGTTVRVSFPRQRVIFDEAQAGSYKSSNAPRLKRKGKSAVA